MDQRVSANDVWCSFKCRYCGIESMDGCLFKYSTFPIDLNAICQTCENQNWNQLYEEQYRKKYLNDENLENFISSKGYSLQKKAILDQNSISTNWHEFNALHNKLWNLTPARSKKAQQVLFVTLNPKDNITHNMKKSNINHLQEYINIILKTCHISNYVYNFEWRNHDEESGLHCHMLLDGNLGKITQHLNRTKHKFHGRIDGSSGNNPGNYLIPMGWWQDKINYMNGITEDEEKNNKKKKDKYLRKKYNLDDIYRK